jgi:hypothetical protein
MFVKDVDASLRTSFSAALPQYLFDSLLDSFFDSLLLCLQDSCRFIALEFQPGVVHVQLLRMSR